MKKYSALAWQMPLLFAASLAFMALSEAPTLTEWGISPLTLAITGGMVLGNTLPAHRTALFSDGIAFSKSHLLRIGIMLYGFRLTLSQVLYVGWPALLADAAVVAGTMFLALRLGRRFGLDTDTAALVGAGSAVCGAAAVLAAQPVLKAQERDVGVAVATVVVFGTLAMFAYPLMAAALLPHDASVPPPGFHGASTRARRCTKWHRWPPPVRYRQPCGGRCGRDYQNDSGDAARPAAAGAALFAGRAAKPAASGSRCRGLCPPFWPP
nr:putative sulfate exporter family transporter [Kingella potus]